MSGTRHTSEDSGLPPPFCDLRHHPGELVSLAMSVRQLTLAACCDQDDRDIYCGVK